MSKFFEPKDLNISGLFKDGDPIYKIPSYQRPYSWEDEQIEALWSDIYESYSLYKEDNENNQNYFLGSLIVVATPKAKVFDVVDGQQRLTTLMILFNVIKGLYPKINKDIDAETIPDVIKARHIESCIYNDNETKRLTFYTDEKHRNAFDMRILKCTNFSALIKPKKIHGVEERFINAAYIFVQKLQDITYEIGDFVNYLFNKVMIIKITCQNENFAIKLFQVLNDRGLDLSQADLIKANLISAITDEEDKASFMASWRDIEAKLEMLDISFSDLFTFQLNYLLSANPKKSLSQELEILFHGKNSNDVICEAQQMVKIYAELYNSENKEWYGFWYLPWDIWKSIFLTTMYSNYEQKEELLKSIKRFFYLFWIAGFTLSAIKQTSYNILKWVKSNRPLLEIKNDLDTKLNEHNIVSTAKDIILSDDVYNKKWIKPVLCLLEYSRREESDFIEWNRKLQVEHILPQKFITAQGWSHISAVDGEKYLNTLGNLTLLSDLKNPEAKHFPFTTKLYVYAGKGVEGKQQKGWTQYQITQEIVNQYTSQQHPVWDSSSIVLRQQKIYQELCEQLQIT